MGNSMPPFFSYAFASLCIDSRIASSDSMDCAASNPRVLTVADSIASRRSSAERKRQTCGTRMTSADWKPASLSARRLHDAGALLGIHVIDHVIVTADGRYHSLADDGVLGGPR